MTDRQQISLKIKQKAIELGFSACGIAKAEELTAEKKNLKKWLDNEMQGEMHYMKNHFDKRTDPTLLVEGAKSIIVVLQNYYPEKKQRKDAPQIAKYAYGKDYHFVLKDKLKELFNYINNEIKTVNGRFFADSAPVMERVWAERAGLGWIGKNGLLINPKSGSYNMIGELIVDIEMAYDKPFGRNYCGKCNRCMEACPTKAIVAPGVLDARKCISYLTIEYKGEIKGDLSNNIFGCDICQDVCPWNRKAKAHKEADFKAKEKILQMNKEEWENLSEEEFKELFRKSPLKRSKYTGLMRNIKAQKNNK